MIGEVGAIGILGVEFHKVVGDGRRQQTAVVGVDIAPHGGDGVHPDDAFCSYLRPGLALIFGKILNLNQLSHYTDRQ